MSFLAGSYGLEKCAELKVLHLNLLLTLNVGAAPTLASIVPSVLSAQVGIITANGAGTLVPGITFASMAPTSATAPVIGVEVADGLVAATATVVHAYGVITAVTGANINLGASVYHTATYVSSGQGIGINLNFGMAGTITGYTQTISGANGTATVSLFIAYFDRN